MKKLQLIAALMAFFLYGCSEQSSLVNPVQTSSNGSALGKGGKKVLTVGEGEGQIHMASQRIIASTGGTVRLQGSYGRGSRIVDYNLSISFGPGALPRDTTISICIDEATFGVNADVTFAPCGLVFNRPGVLLLYANNVDIALQNGPLSLTYYDSGTWQPMPNSWGAYLTNDHGYVVAGAQIPHFSRYAFGR
jgi:hypothetical protein